MESCEGICQRYKFKRDPSIKGSGFAPYVLGAKRCQTCSIYIKWDKIFCPCCGRKLRVKPHLAPAKKRYNELMKYEPVRY